MSTPLQLSARIKDAWGIETSTVIYGQMDSTEDLTSVAAEMQQRLMNLDGITDGAITEAHVTLPIVLTGVKTAAATGSRVEQTGLIGFSAAGTSKRYSFEVPAIAGNVLSGDRVVMTGTGPMGLFTAGLLNPAGNMTFNGCNETNQPLTAVLDFIVSFRKRRRQLSRSSFEAAP